MMPPIPNLLRGERIRLSALTKDDVPTITRWYDNAEFARLYESTPAAPRPPASVEEWVSNLGKTGEAFSFGIRLLEDDRLIGMLELDEIEWAHGSGGLSLAIGEPEYWGKGYGSEALALALRFAFDELNLHRVELTVFAYNQRAIAMYEKLGFVREGVFRERIHRDGQRHDMYLYGLLRHEWETRNNAGE
jgi:RimJ/RimL family protein N-acetyltransferase